MIDRTVSAGRVIAGALWTTSLLIWAASWMADLDHLGRLAIIFAAAAGVAQVRVYLIEQQERIKTALTVTTTVSRNVSRLPRT